MSRLIRCSDRDVQTLARLRAVVPEDGSKDQLISYRDKVVVKPWGYEFLVFENDQVAVWFLHIEKGHATSMHCHPRKKTALLVLQGQVLCNTFYNRNYLSAPEAIVIDAGVFHSTQSLSPSGADLIEVETPPDKTDLVRLNDQYGRQGRGYEGLAEMKTENLERFGYFHFSEGVPQLFQGRSFDIGLTPFPRGTSFEGQVQPERTSLYCACRGRLVDDQGQTVLDVGDAADGLFFQVFERVTAETDCLVLSCSSRVVRGES